MLGRGHPPSITIDLDGLDIGDSVHIHVDFLRLGAGQRISIAVPVHFSNHEASPGLKRGGVLNIVRHEIELLCPADNIPEQIEIDLVGWEIGGSIHISHVNAVQCAAGDQRSRLHDTTIAGAGGKEEETTPRRRPLSRPRPPRSRPPPRRHRLLRCAAQPAKGAGEKKK